MQEEVNEWGYSVTNIKKPFIYTEKTLGLRKTEDKIPEMEIFYLADRGLTFQDILVITAYDLSNLKKIILSKHESMKVATIFNKKVWSAWLEESIQL